MTTARILRFGPWHIPGAVQHALCSDGRRRYARITSQPDTFFSIPASVNVHGRTVSGFITKHETEDGSEDYEFVANSYGKNGHLLPGFLPSATTWTPASPSDPLPADEPLFPEISRFRATPEDLNNG